MYVIVLDFIPEKGKWFFDGISNELCVTCCNSLDVCVHYNDGHIFRQVSSRLCNLCYPCHVEVIV